MEINRLLADELNYELMIRGYELGRNVQEKRASLRRAMEEERQGKIAILDLQLDPTSELGVCSTKLDELAGYIEEFDNANAVNEYKKIKTRLLHVNGRLGRVAVGSMTERKKQHLQFYCSKLHEALEDALQIARLTMPSTSDQHSILDDPNPSLSSGDVDDLITFTEPENVKTQEEVASAFALPEITSRPTPGFSYEFPENNTRRTSRVKFVDTKGDHLFEEHASTFKTETWNVPPAISSLHSNLATKGSREDELVHRLHDVSLFQPACSSSRRPSTQTINRLRQNHLQFPEAYLAMQRDTEAFGPGQFSNYQTAANPISATHTKQIPQLSIDCDRQRSIPFSKWNIYFDGTASVTSFLEDIEDKAESRGILESQLYQSVSEFLKGDALLWYRPRKYLFTDWDDFKKKIREAFLPFDYEASLMDDIRKRTQGPEEKLIVFVSKMQGLFRKLSSQPTEKEQVNRIRRNLLPYLQTGLALQNFETIEELLTYGKIVEECDWRAKQYAPPPTNPKTMQEPELACRRAMPHKTSLVAFQNNPMQPEPNRSAIQRTDSSQAAINKKTICWKCKQPGHMRNECKQPLKLACMKCGTAGYTSRTCPNCQGNSFAGH